MSLGLGPKIPILALEKMCPLGIGHSQLVDPGWREKIKSAPCACWNCFYSRDLLFVFSLGLALAIFCHHLVKWSNNFGLLV
jgi:hypothetical protein